MRLLTVRDTRSLTASTWSMNGRSGSLPTCHQPPRQNRCFSDPIDALQSPSFAKTKSMLFRPFDMPWQPLWGGVSVMANQWSENNRFGLDARVGGATRSAWFYLQTILIYKLGFNHNCFTFTLISLIKIVLCRKFT